MSTSGSPVAGENEERKTVKLGHDQKDPDAPRPGALQTSLINAALMLTNFLVALDVNIVTTAIPTITAEFHSLNQTGFYGSAFFICLASFPTFWGKAFKYYPLKPVFLLCIAIFELGSLVAAVAPTSAAVIAGRAIQGVGAAGVSSGAYTICAFVNAPEKVPIILALFATVWTVASVVGPVIGGAFTSYVTWRWCFYINLPIGGAAALALLVFFHTPPQSRLARVSWKRVPIVFDFVGVVLILGALICYTLALEKGGLTLPWNSSQPIGLLVGFGLLILAFGTWEWYQGENAMVVPRILARRSILVLGLFNFFSQASGFARNYNLPIFFQAAQGVSPAESGVRTLPTVLAVSIFSFISAIAITKAGYYQAFLFVGSIIMTVGSGLIYTLQPNSSSGEYIGYQVVAGIGTGITIQINLIVAQAISTAEDKAVTVAIAVFWQSIAGAIGVSASQSILNNLLLKSLPAGIPSISPSSVVAAGSNGLRQAFPDPGNVALIVDAYMRGLKAAWIWSIALAGAAFLVSFGAEWRSVRAEDVEARRKAKETTNDATSAA